MEVVKRAALAPAQPSPEDRTEAAVAERLEAQAQQQLAAKAHEKMKAVMGGNRPRKGTLIELMV